MKKLLSVSAFSLIELIVSAMLVVIVLLGIFSINTVLNNNNQDYGQRYLVKSETQLTLNHILSNAALAVGSSVTNDQGILYGVAGVGDANSFCIHQAGTTPTTLNPNGGQNLINNTTDIWLCYTWYPSSDPNYPNQIRWCAEKYPAGAVNSPGSVSDPRGATSCSSAPVANLIPNNGNNTTFLGTAFSITNTGGSSLLTSPNFVQTGTQLLFSIAIQNCLNDALSTCKASGNSTDLTNNPEVVVSGSVSPSQESSSLP